MIFLAKFTLKVAKEHLKGLDMRLIEYGMLKTWKEYFKNLCTKTRAILLHIPAFKYTE